jgi:hypothetical protein
MAQAHVHAPFQVKLLNKSAICNVQFAMSRECDTPASRLLPLRSVFVRPYLIFGSRYRVVREPAVVHAVPIRVADLFVVGPIAFDRAFVNVGIVLVLHSHADHHVLPRERGLPSG